MFKNFMKLESGERLLLVASLLLGAGMALGVVLWFVAGCPI